MISESLRNSLLKRTSLSYALIALLMLTTVMTSFSLSTWPSQQQHEVLAQEQEQEQQMEQQRAGSVLKLSRANIPIDIPLSKGYIDGNVAYFIATDASDKQTVDSISNNTGFTINYAPLLAQTPNSSRGQGYIFTNGIQGEGPNGFQIPVANAVPGDSDYSPLWQTNFVK